MRSTSARMPIFASWSASSEWARESRRSSSTTERISDAREGGSANEAGSRLRKTLSTRAPSGRSTASSRSLSGLSSFVCMAGNYRATRAAKPAVRLRSRAQHDDRDVVVGVAAAELHRGGLEAERDVARRGGCTALRELHQLVRFEQLRGRAGLGDAIGVEHERVARRE